MHGAEKEPHATRDKAFNRALLKLTGMENREPHLQYELLSSALGLCALQFKLLVSTKRSHSHTQNPQRRQLSAAKAFAAAARRHVAELLARPGCHTQRLQLPADKAPGYAPAWDALQHSSGQERAAATMTVATIQAMSLLPHMLTLLCHAASVRAITQ